MLNEEDNDSTVSSRALAILELFIRPLKNLNYEIWLQVLIA